LLRINYIETGENGKRTHLRLSRSFRTNNEVVAIIIILYYAKLAAHNYIKYIQNTQLCKKLKTLNIHENTLYFVKPKITT